MQRGGHFAKVNKSDAISLAESIPLSAKLQDLGFKTVTPSANMIKSEYTFLLFLQHF